MRRKWHGEGALNHFHRISAAHFGLLKMLFTLLTPNLAPGGRKWSDNSSKAPLRFGAMTEIAALPAHSLPRIMTDILLSTYPRRRAPSACAPRESADYKQECVENSISFPRERRAGAEEKRIGGSMQRSITRGVSNQFEARSEYEIECVR